MLFDDDEDREFEFSLQEECEIYSETVDKKLMRTTNKVLKKAGADKEQRFTGLKTVARMTATKQDGSYTVPYNKLGINDKSKNVGYSRPGQLSERIDKTLEKHPKLAKKYDKHMLHAMRNRMIDRLKNDM